MKKVIAWLLVLALTAAVSIGATLAYLTDTDEDVNVMTLGKVKIDQLEYERIDDETKDEDATVQEFHDNKPLYPGVYEDGFDFTTDENYVNWDQIGKEDYTSGIWNPDEINNEVDKMVFVKNKGDYDAYVRSVFAFEAGNYTTLDEFREKVHLNLNETDYTWEWAETPVTIGDSKYFVATATYNEVLAPGALTEISLGQIALDKTATNEDVLAFGDTYQVLVKSQGIQADGFADPDTALKEGFGEIITGEASKEVSFANLPWENDSATKGIDLRTALHYYEGGTTMITSKVSNVIFGLNKDHVDITEGYTGTLVDVEQDVNVYAYYVPNGSNYDVYFLAEDSIYAPKDSSRLFQGMSSLVGVDTSNLDTGRVELMNHLFYKCSALKNVDVSGFDTGKTTTMKSMFNLCSSLADVDVSNWDTGNVTDTSYMFYKCTAMTDLDLTGLDMENVKTTKAMFGFSTKLKTVDATGWDLTGLTEGSGMFVSCTGMTEIVGSGGWYMPNVIAVDSMIQQCDSLEYIDVTDWDLSSAENMYSMFWNCDVLKTIDGCENWNTGSVTTMKAMFESSHSLKDVDVSTWDTGNVKDMSHMFRSHGIEELDVSNWDVSNVVYFNSMFSASSSNTGAMSIQSLDLSKWDTQNAVTMNNMFHGCSQLLELDLRNWDVSNVTTTSHMFSDCFNIQSIDFTGWNTASLTSMDGMFNDCRGIKVLDLSDFDTATVEEFSQIFEACHSLEQIIGLDKWDTSKGTAFDEMFNQAHSLKELDLSSFDTRSAKNYVVMQNGGIYYGFSSMFAGMNSLEKLILGGNFDFNGDGSITTGYPRLPNPAAINGETTMWYNIANDTYYSASDIPEPEGVTVTYVAANPPANP